MWLGNVIIGTGTISWKNSTHSPSGGLADADALPTYRIYSPGDTLVASGSMVKDATKTGRYTGSIAATIINGFAENTFYYIDVEATVGGVSGRMTHTFNVQSVIAADPWERPLPGSYTGLKAGKILGDLILSTSGPTIANNVWQKTGGRTITNSIPTANEVRDSVLGAALSGYLVSGTVGKKLGDIVSDVLAKTPAQYGAGQVGALVGTIPATTAANVWATSILGAAASTRLGQIYLSTDGLSVGNFDDIPLNVWEYVVNSGFPANSAGQKLSEIQSFPGIGGDLRVVPFTLTKPDDSPVQGATIMVTFNEDGSGVIASAATDLTGTVNFLLGVGTYYFWAQKTGFNVDNPTEVIVED